MGSERHGLKGEVPSPFIFLRVIAPSYAHTRAGVPAPQLSPCPSAHLFHPPPLTVCRLEWAFGCTPSSRSAAYLSPP